MSYKLISKINISEYKHSHNLSKALYIKRIALSCQTSNLIKILSNHFDKGEKSTWSISKCEYICISNDSTCPEQYKQEYCSKQYVCYAYKKTYSYCLLKAGNHRNQELCVWNCFSCNRKILPMEKKFAYELAYGEFKYIYSHVITNEVVQNWWLLNEQYTAAVNEGTTKCHKHRPSIWAIQPLLWKA